MGLDGDPPHELRPRRRDGGMGWWRGPSSYRALGVGGTQPNSAHSCQARSERTEQREILPFSLAVDFSGFGSCCFLGICPFVNHSWLLACGTEVTKSQALLFVIEAGTGGRRCTLCPRAVGTILLPLVCHGDLGKGGPEPGWEGSAEEDHVPRSCVSPEPPLTRSACPAPAPGFWTRC